MTVSATVGTRLAMAIVVRGGLVLLQRRWRRGPGLVYEFPGGRAEPTESWARAAARELREETGLDESVVVSESVARSRDGGTIAFVVFDSSSDLPPERTVESRQQEFLWLAPADVPADELEPADARFASRKLPALVEHLRLGRPRSTPEDRA